MQYTFNLSLNDGRINMQLTSEEAGRLLDDLQQQFMQHKALADAATSFKQKTLMIYYNDGAVSAIKHIRNHIHCSLRLAKDALDYWKEEAACEAGVT